MTEPSKIIEIGETDSGSDGRRHIGPLLGTVNDHQVISCQPCGFTHAFPLPTAAEVEGLYAEDYYSNEKPDYLAKAEQEAKYWSRVYQERYRQLERFGGGPGRILDVGCSGGWFLEVGRDRGWEVEGIEPSQQAARMARSRGLSVKAQFLHRLDPAAYDADFDAVHAALVIEHLADPRSFVRWAVNTLRPGGVLCVEAPNDYNPLQLALTKQTEHRNWWLAPPHHLNYFNTDTLAGLLTESGLEIVGRSCTFPMELFVLLGFDYISEPTLGKECHARRMALETTLLAVDPDLMNRIYGQLAEIGLGRTSVIFGAKNR